MNLPANGKLKIEIHFNFFKYLSHYNQNYYELSKNNNFFFEKKKK